MELEGERKMIIKCLECGHDVSDKAMACPNCGAPIAQTRDYTPVRYDVKADEQYGTFCWWLGFLFNLFGILIGAIISRGYGAKKAFIGMLWSWLLFTILAIGVVIHGMRTY